MTETLQSNPESSLAAAPARGRLILGVPKEIHPGERRVAVVPRMAAKLAKLGFEVIVESGAGDAAAFTDHAYVEAGARIVPDAAKVWAEADLVLKVRQPEMNPALNVHEADLLKEGARLISFVWPAQNKDLLERLARRKATVLAMDAVPRITRAQKLDALSAMANIAGYRAVIESASVYGRFLGGQITAAGSVRPATVLVLGAGVAGLAAVGCAKSLGAIVKAFDTREAVREQVESLGGQFIKFEFDEKGEGEGGYAKQMSDAYLAAEQEFIAGHAKDADIVITTALIPGKPAPKLLTSGAVVSMKTGSVVVDLAAEQGGNCALTERDRVVERYGVTIIGLTDLASRLSRQASELYSCQRRQPPRRRDEGGRFRPRPQGRGPARDARSQGRRADVAAASRSEVRAAAPQPVKPAAGGQPHREAGKAGAVGRGGSQSGRGRGAARGSRPVRAGKRSSLT